MSQSLSSKIKRGLPAKEQKDAKEFFDSTAPSGDTLGGLHITPKGLEEIGEKLNETQKKVLNIILTDFSPESGIEAEKDVFKKLRNACKRAGMLDGGGKEQDFFRTVADPKFNETVKIVGCGLIGMNVLEIVGAVYHKGVVEGDKTCLKWLLEILGLLPNKFDFYLQRYQLNHIQIGNQNVNLGDKTDEELEAIWNDINDEPDAIEVACASGN